MDVISGYRRTDVGVIPDDWDVQRLSSLVTKGPKNGYSGRSSKEARGTPTLSLGATTSGALVLNDETVKRLEERIDEQSDLFLRSGDVLVQRSNTIDLVGTTAVFSGPSGVFVYPDLMMRIRFREEATAHWFWRYANSAEGRRFFMSVAAGSSGSMPKISGDKLRRMQLPVPPLPEQYAIAATLSEVDSLLSGLEHLITKKRDLKQAAMQQLLAGETRLPGFHGEWEVKAVADIADVTKGTQLHRSETNEEGPFPHFNGGISPSSYTDKANAAADTIAISEGGNSCGYVQLVRERFWCGGHCYALVPRGADNRFLYHALKGQQAALMRLRVGSGLPNVQKTALEAFKVNLPSDPAEQTAIAATLSDMDAELRALEARRDKTGDLRQAMMQELLTGRTRLV